MAEGASSWAGSGGYPALLRNRPYCALLGSTVLEHLGASLWLTVLPWLVLDLTGSESATGWATTAIYLPYLLFSLPAGALVDRLDRQRLMVVVNVLRALLAAAVPLLHMARMLAGWHTLLIASLLSALALVFYLARCSILPQIVPKQELVTANSANVVCSGLAMIAGAAVVGPVVRVGGLGNAPAVLALTLALSTVVLSLLELPLFSRAGKASRPPTGGDMMHGLSFAWRTPLVRTIFLLDSLYFLLADGLVMAGLPLFVRDVLGAGPQAYGFVRTAGHAGMLLGALWLGHYGRSLDRSRLIVLCWFGYGLSIGAHLWFRSLGGSLAASFFCMLLGNLIPTCSSSLLQEEVPEAMLGRVFGVWTMIAPGLGSFSGLIAGALAPQLVSSALIGLGAAISCGNALLGRIGGLWPSAKSQGGS